MKTIIFSRLAMAALVLFSASAQAAVTCTSVISSGFSSTRDSLVATDTLNQGSFTIVCSRAVNDPTTTVFYAALAKGSANATASNFRARLGATSSYLNYNVYTNSSYSNDWSKNNNCITGSFSVSSSSSNSLPIPYYAKIPASQNVPPGTYSDTPLISVNYLTTGAASCPNNGSGNFSGSFQVQITNTASCQIGTPPGTVAFTYTAFAPAPATASTTFTIRCANTTPYTMALDANAGVVSGLNYALTLSATSGTGTGIAQGYSINGTMAAGQAGSCASANCTASDRRTLTVTY